MRIDYNNPRQNDAFCLPYHYEMISDNKRVSAFKKSIEQVCKGKIVLESGTGSGILSIMAARAGAKKVFAIEKDPVVGLKARANFKSAQLTGVIEFIEKDLLELRREDLGGETPQVIIAENLSTWMTTEPIMEVMNHLHDLFPEPEIVRLPSTVSNYIELAQTQYLFEDMIEMKTYFFEFTGVERPVALSYPTLFKRFDFNQKHSGEISESCFVFVQQPGEFNSVRLTSPIVLADKVAFDQSDSLMPPVIFPIRDSIQVLPGDQIRLDISYKTHSDWSQFDCIATKL